MVIDTSIILAIYFNEANAAWAAEQMNLHVGQLVMSTVNLTEVLIRVRDRIPDRADALEAQLLSSGIRFVPPDEAQARIAAQGRIRFPLNLGDCFAYALAVALNLPILTLDSDFKRLDCQVVLP